MAAERCGGSLAEWRAMLQEMAAALAASTQAGVTLEIDVTNADGTRFRARGAVHTLPHGGVDAGAGARGGGRQQARRQQAVKPSTRPACHGAPEAPGRRTSPPAKRCSDDTLCQPACSELSHRQRKSILRLARKVKMRKLAAVAKLAPAMAAWVRRIRSSLVPSPAMWWRCYRQSVWWMQRKAAVVARRKREAEEAAATEGWQQLLGSAGSSSSNTGDEALESAPKRQSRPSSRADGGDIT